MGCGFPEDGACLAELGGDKLVMFLFAEFEESSGVFVADGNRDFFWELQCCGAGTIAVGEDVKVRYGE